ncbi:hypothetical protein [Rheinheimera sp. WS51]|uniref:hypothetical protein n=1 Tax=Rheinheimera sp. WS51 TaxID=3425886 RepID=UPI003D8A4A24
MAMHHIRSVMLTSLIMTSFVTEAGQNVVSDEYHRLYPRMFCKADISADECLKWASSYVAQKYIRANNDYYRKLVDDRVRVLFKKHVENRAETYDPNKRMMLESQVKKDLVNDIAEHWLRTGLLPEIN